MRTIHQRIKKPEGWRFVPVAEGRGRRTGDLHPPFYVRYSANGTQHWQRLLAQTFAEARAEAEKFEDVLEAGEAGLTVAEAETYANVNRTPLKKAIETFLQGKTGKAPKTLAQYNTALTQFEEIVRERGIRFVDEIADKHMYHYKSRVLGEGFAAKTLDTRYNVVREMLAKNDVKANVSSSDMPAVEEEPAVPFSPEQLKKLLEAANGMRLAFRFFLGTGCREQEVSFASWSDIDFERKTYHVRAKSDVGFTPKSHESRTIPLPTPLVRELAALHKTTGSVRWIFPNTEGNPEGHFLRHLKRIALRAGLNCGHCTNAEGESCRIAPTCKHIYLHRFRKTAATRWCEEGVSLRNVQHYLGHKSLEVTQKYLGVTDNERVRSKIDSAFGD